MSSLIGLSRLARPHILVLSASTLLLALHGLTTGAYAYLVGPLLKFIYTGGQTAGSNMTRTLLWLGYRPNDDLSTLTTFIAVIVVALVVAKGLAYFGGTYLVASTGQHMEHELRMVLFDHLLRLSFDRIAEIPRGDTVSRFIYDVSSVKFAVTHGITGLVRDVLQVIVLAGLAVYLDPILGLLALTVIPFSTTIILRLGARLRTRRRRAHDAMGELGSTTVQTATALAVLRVFGAEHHARAKFEELSNRVLRRNLKAWALQVFSSPLMELLGAIALAATLWYAGTRISAGALAPEEFVSFFAAVFMMYRPIRSIGDGSTMIYGGLAALDRINELVAFPEEPADPPTASSPTGVEREIRFEGVSFAYKEKEPILEDVTFSLYAGETVAIVGPSGAGKTTLAMLLLRLIEPTSGRLFLDDTPLEELKRSALRKIFALVTQEPVLLNDRIEANISFGLEVPRPRVEQAARAAGIHDFITSLPQGYETSVGEAGARLSGGERQRICIARALLRDPPALILDEATAAVDSATEAEIAASLEELMRGRTTLLISHRLSTVRRADRIVLLEKGRIAAQGSFAELVSTSEPFRRIFSDQLTSTTPRT